jgi:hypothetical protein
MKRSFFTAFIIMMLFSSAGAALDNVEAGKIEFLISSVENLNGAKFIRNGTEHDSREAGRHLRLKLKRAEKYIKNADDFIKINSRSYITGEVYLIKFPDGRTVEAEKFLRERLKEYKGS